MTFIFSVVKDFILFALAGLILYLVALGFEDQIVARFPFVEKGAWPLLIWILLYAFLDLILSFATIPHMISVNRKTKELNKVRTADYFASARTKKGLPAMMTQLEADRGFDLLGQALDKLSVTDYDEQGAEYKRAGTMTELVQMQKLTEQVAAMMPTDKDLVEKLNNMKSFLYSHLQRKVVMQPMAMFVSLFVPVIATIFALLVVQYYPYLMLIPPLLFVPTIVLRMSSKKPRFMIERGDKSFFSVITSAITVAAAATAAAGPTIRKTTYSDGTTETTTDHTRELTGLGMMGIMAIISTKQGQLTYLKNYVLFDERNIFQWMFGMKKKVKPQIMHNPKAAQNEAQDDKPAVNYPVAFAFKEQDGWYYPCHILEKEGSKVKVEFLVGKKKDPKQADLPAYEVMDEYNALTGVFIEKIESNWNNYGTYYSCKVKDKKSDGKRYIVVYDMDGVEETVKIEQFRVKKKNN